MASGSGKNQDDTETKEPVDSLRLREESTAAASATELPPLASQSEIIEEDVHGPPEAGGRNHSAATATAAAAEQKGEETMSLFLRGSAGGEPPLPPRPPSVSRARGPGSAGGKEVWASGMENRVDLKDVSNELMLESQRERSGETDQKAEEGMPRQQNEQVKSEALWPKKYKKPFWRKFLDRIGNFKRNCTIPHVNFQLKSPAIWPRKDKKLLWRKCDFPGRKTVMIVVLLIFSILLLPVQTEAFQEFQNAEDALQRLVQLNDLGELLLQLEEQAAVPGARFNLRPVMFAILRFLLRLFQWLWRFLLGFFHWLIVEY